MEKIWLEKNVRKYEIIVQIIVCADMLVLAQFWVNNALGILSPPFESLCQLDLTKGKLERKLHQGGRVKPQCPSPLDCSWLPVFSVKGHTSASQLSLHTHLSLCPVISFNPSGFGIVDYYWFRGPHYSFQFLYMLPTLNSPQITQFECAMSFLPESRLRE